ncbi:hypothetical protein H072_9579 [Dactylellina haptotyla CBS 200.50]|uniref:Uncharacterized protein n=1 Tax=Dactylellina haptotyla (strain CBS 200.50) TaxID=1284197 RepID=S8BC88_DACHA|nr:hypothetical protein H072_9579 [Dactylellina haptotyla CBS 200.50]
MTSIEEKVAVLSKDCESILDGRTTESRVCSIGVTTEKSVTVDIGSRKASTPVVNDSAITENVNLCLSHTKQSGDLFDFIHIRYQDDGSQDEKQMFVEAFRHAKPGGWVEVLDNSRNSRSSLPPGKLNCSGSTYPSTFFGGGSILVSSRTPTVALRIKQHLLDAGFVDVEEKTWQPSITAWKRLKEWGSFLRLVCCSILTLSLPSANPPADEKLDSSTQPTPTCFVIGRKPY